MSSSRPLSDTDLDALVAKLDLETKVRLLSGAGDWTTQPVQEIGLGPVTFSDGPVGVRGAREDERDTSAALTSPSGMAATWDEELLSRVGRLLAGEAVRKGVDVALGPTINLHRSPVGGRHFECFSEDPLLSGRLATAYVRGLQEQGVGACPKHYVANDAETDRTTVDNRVDERTLRELYLAPFESVVEDADPWMVMAAYNGVNGAPMTENELLAHPLKDEWGSSGVVVSDWTALYNGEPAARAALDLAMPGPDPKWGSSLVEAVRAGRVAESAIDSKVRRLLLLAARTGHLDGVLPPAAKAAPSGIHDGLSLARETASAAAVLVRNDGLLPLRAEELRRVAVVGPHALDPRPLGGGSATVYPPSLSTPVAGLAAALHGRAEVSGAFGVALSDALRPPRPDELESPDGSSPAVLRWLGPDGRVLAEEGCTTAVFRREPATIHPGAVALEVSTRFTAEIEGEWALGFTGVGAFSLELDGHPVLEETFVRDRTDIGAIVFAPPQASVPVVLRKGEGVDVRLRFQWAEDLLFFIAGLAVRAPRRETAGEFQHAVEVARDADVAVVVVGTTEGVESEGFDRTSLSLPGHQDELVRAVAAVNPRTVVVLNAGSPVELPWLDDVAAVLIAWFPGMEFGNALADVLLGAVEPGGRLPTTWPKAMVDVPVLDTTPTGGRLDYTEGLHIGHRAYLRAGTEPALWFGHGLGYTTWAWEGLSVRKAPLTAVVRVRNTGERAGKQVVQVYASRPESAVERPVRWLAGFAVVRAEPGETVEVPVEIAPRTLRHWTADGWAVEPGELVLSTGPSAGDLPVSTTVTLG